MEYWILFKAMPANELGMYNLGGSYYLFFLPGFLSWEKDPGCDYAWFSNSSGITLDRTQGLSERTLNFSCSLTPYFSMSILVYLFYLGYFYRKDSITFFFKVWIPLNYKGNGCDLVIYWKPPYSSVYHRLLYIYYP